MARVTAATTRMYHRGQTGRVGLSNPEWAEIAVSAGANSLFLKRFCSQKGAGVIQSNAPGATVPIKMREMQDQVAPRMIFGPVPLCKDMNRIPGLPGQDLKGLYKCDRQENFVTI